MTDVNNHTQEPPKPQPSNTLLNRYGHILAILQGGWFCYYCHEQLDPHFATIDHVTPKAQGGRNDLDNLVLCCHSCNCHKGNRTPEQWSAAKANPKLPKKPWYIRREEWKRQNGK